MGCYLGFDVGTQGTKGVLVDESEGRIVARASRGYGLIEDRETGSAEQHPAIWREAVAAVAAELLAAAPSASVEGIGVSGQQHGAVILDEDDAPLRPAKLWCDTSTAAEAAELSDKLGRSVPTGFTASKLLWTARHEPQLWERARRVLLPHDYINFTLTGTATMEPGDASGTGFFDPVERNFCERSIAAIDPKLESMLAPLVEPGHWAGRLDANGARLLGLPEGVPVSSGGGDNMMSAIGSGAVSPGVVTLSLGTSGTVFTNTDKPVVDPDGAIAPFMASSGGWLPLLCVMNVTAVTEEVLAAFGSDHDALTKKASDVAPGCDGLMWIPYLAGERVPDLPGASGTLLGMRSGHLAPGPMYRAAIEGAALNLAWGVERMRNLGIDVSEVRVVGGAAANPLWRRVLADALNAKVVAPIEQESAALGAALQAMWCGRNEAAGSARPIDDTVAEYVALSETVTEPESAGVNVYAELRGDFVEKVGRVFG